jgi:ribosomal subunit interface protein
MEIRVSGHQVETGEALRTHVEERLQAIADKYFSRSISAHVTFGRGQHGNGFSCDIVAHVMQGVILKGSGSAMDAHPAFDQAADRIETQLRRYMRRLKDRSAAPVPAMAEYEENAGYTVFETTIEEEVNGEHPVIIA